MILDTIVLARFNHELYEASLKGRLLAISSVSLRSLGAVWRPGAALLEVSVARA